VQEEMDLDRFFIEDLAGHAAEPGRTRRVRAGRANHDRTHHIENGYFAVMADGHGFSCGAKRGLRNVVTRNDIPYTETLMMSSKPIILVVDDDLPILALMRSLLRQFGFEAVTAESGGQALDQARARPPSAVLIDRNMPGMTGDELIRALRKEPGLDQLPILVISGQAVSSAELATLGADGALLKPFDVPELIAQLRSFVAAEQPV